MGLPEKQGLYDPRNEHDACGVGFVVNIKGRKSHTLIRDALQILLNLDHRGAVGADPLVGDGAGCLVQTPDRLLRDWAEKNNVHELYFMCDDIQAFVARMKAHVIECEPVKDEGWGLLTHLTLPGGGKIGVYQPRHPRPPATPPR